MHDDLRSNLRRSYDQNAAERDTTPRSALKVEARQSFLELLRGEQKETLLEIGAGTGQDSLFFQEQGLEVVCVDLSEEHVRYCRQKGLNAHQADVAELQFPANTFEAVYSLNYLLHLPKAEMPRALRVIEGILKPSGLLYLGQHGGRDHEGIFKDDRHEPSRFFSFYDDSHILKLVMEVFQVHSFDIIPWEDNSEELHFQSMVLRKQGANPIGV